MPTRTSRRHDRARHNLDRPATYVVAAYLAEDSRLKKGRPMRLAPRADHWWTVGEGVVIDVPPWEPRPQRGPAEPQRISPAAMSREPKRYDLRRWSVGVTGIEPVTSAV
jgi:hypothetical protein